MVTLAIFGNRRLNLHSSLLCLSRMYVWYLPILILQTSDFNLFHSKCCEIVYRRWGALHTAATVDEPVT
jgi:hypothetical protein